MERPDVNDADAVQRALPAARNGRRAWLGGIACLGRSALLHGHLRCRTVGGEAMSAAGWLQPIAAGLPGDRYATRNRQSAIMTSWPESSRSTFELSGPASVAGAGPLE
jgi:hypothetical protein